MSEGSNATARPIYGPAPAHVPAQTMPPTSHPRSRFRLYVYVAPVTPPTTRDTLLNIDARNELQKEDFLHEMLYTEPTITFSRVVIDQALRNTSPLRRNVGAPVSAHDVLVSNQHDEAFIYWLSLYEEITTGCRCTRWQVTYDGHPVNPRIIDYDKLPGCSCGRWIPALSTDHWLYHVQRSQWPSRFLEVIYRKFKECSALSSERNINENRPTRNPPHPDGYDHPHATSIPTASRDGVCGRDQAAW